MKASQFYALVAIAAIAPQFHVIPATVFFVVVGVLALILEEHGK